MPQLTPDQLFEARKDALGLTWVAGRAGATRTITTAVLADPTLGLVGHLNLIRPFVIQVIGVVEHQHLVSMGHTRRENALEKLFDQKPSSVIVADSLPVSEELIELAELTSTPLFASTVTSKLITINLGPFLHRRLGEITEMHGVFLDVLGAGVLIRGDSSIGKSELALELISRGAGLVADDVVELQQVGPETIQGRCPEMLRNMLEVRGLGVLNIQAIFGQTLVRPRKTLNLIVSLQESSTDSHRLETQSGTERVLGVNIPTVTLQVKAGRNLAVLVEAAVRNFILITRGINSNQEFIARHRQAMSEAALQLVPATGKDKSA